jgi:hypothetical protein
MGARMILRQPALLGLHETIFALFLRDDLA